MYWLSILPRWVDHFKAGEVQLLRHEATANVSATEMNSFLSHGGDDVEFRIKRALIILCT